ncbi:MAG: oligosaccharide flippase family protein [Muribaculaceae bacterium]|nr:oligosaccharide flippase family protein [Muribaculaceae bacterium]
MSIVRNFAFSAVLTAANFVFPFIVYPYVSRVLGVDKIGACNFVDSIVSYASLISMMGVVIVGTRNIAKARGDKRRLDSTFTALVFINLIFTMIATVALVVATYTVDALASYRKMLLIGIIKLWGTFFLIEWLYKGLEDFKYITIRSIIVKALFAVSVFVLIKQSEDYVLYFLLMCLMEVGNAVFNCVRAHKLVKFEFDMHSVVELIGPFLILGVYIALNSMYTTFNVIYLGYVYGDTEVGYYTTAHKIFKILLAIYTAYSTVVLPHASSLIEQGRHEEFKGLIRKSVDGLMLFSLPVVAFSIIFSAGIVNVISGSGYEGAIVPMMIVMPLVFIIGYEQILVVQILTPLVSDSVILFNSCIGASVGILGNILLVGRFAAVGSAIVWLASELAVLIVAQIFVHHFTKIGFPWSSLAKNVLAYLPYIALAVGFGIISPLGVDWNMWIGLVVLVPYFFVVQHFVLKNPIYGYSLGIVKSTFSKFAKR